MGDNEPKSQRLSLQVLETALWARKLSASFKEGPPEPGGHQGRRSPPPSRTEPPAADVKGDQPGLEKHSGVCSSALSAVVWPCLSCTLKVVDSTLLGPSDKCLGTLDGKWGIFPGAYLWVVLFCRHGYSDLMCRYLRHVSLLDVSALT